MYPWSQKNDYFMLCSEDSIAVGGGHSFAIYLVRIYIFMYYVIDERRMLI